MTRRDRLLASIVVVLVTAVGAAALGNWLATVLALGNAQALYGWRCATPKESCQ